MAALSLFELWSNFSEYEKITLQQNWTIANWFGTSRIRIPLTKTNLSNLRKFVFKSTCIELILRFAWAWFVHLADGHTIENKRNTNESQVRQQAHLTTINNCSSLICQSSNRRFFVYNISHLHYVFAHRWQEFNYTHGDARSRKLSHRAQFYSYHLMQFEYCSLHSSMPTAGFKPGPPA